MIVSKPLMLITLGACILGLSALGSEKNPVPRSFKGSSTFTTVVNLVSGSYETTGVGIHSHLGLSTVYTTGEMEVSLDPFAFTVLSHEGIVTAANGDQFFYELQGGAFPITGGTGRFAGATGSVFPGSVLEDFEVTIDLVTMTMTTTYGATIEGTIIY